MGKLSSAIRQLRLKRSRKSLAHAIADDATSSLPAKRFRPDQPAINSNALLVDEEYQEKLQQLKEEWDGSRRTAVISFPRNIFRSLEILFRSLEIHFVHFVLSKSASFPPNTLPPAEIPIVSPSRLASKLAGTVLRNADELKKKLSTFSLGEGGGGSQTLTECRYH